MPTTSPSNPPHPAEALLARALKPTLLVAAPFILVLHALPFLTIGLVRFRNGYQGGPVLQATSTSPAAQALAALGFLALGSILLVAAWGFWANRLWARPLIIAYGVIATVASLLFGAFPSAVLAAVVTSFVWTYLYDADSPRAYYARLEEEEEEGRRGELA